MMPSSMKNDGARREARRSGRRIAGRCLDGWNLLIGRAARARAISSPGETQAATACFRRVAVPIWAVICVTLVPFARAQVNEENADPENGRAAMFQRIQKLVGSFRTLGNWDDQYGMMIDSMERVYERQGWNTESDQFSLDLVKTVESVPPWNVQERFDTTIRTLSDRYFLDEDQERSLRGRMMRLSHETFSRHSARIMEYAVDAVQTRASGQPFTPEMVQKWVTLAEPVFLDVRERMNGAAKEFGQELDPEQRALLEQDLGAAQKRLSKVAEMGESWKRGEWTADQWGMEDDPIQNGAYVAGNAGQPGGAPGAKTATETPRTIEGAPVPGSEPPGPGNDGEPPTEEQPVQPGASEPQGAQPPPVDVRPPPQLVNDPWSRFVEAFIGKYALTGDQSTRAWQIFATVRTRRDEMQAKFDKRIAAVPAADAQAPGVERQRAQHTSAMQRLFEQLSRRLEQLPTRAQRAAAKPGELPNPVAPTVGAAPPPKPAAPAQPTGADPR